jgi:hypothetical protein
MRHLATLVIGLVICASCVADDPVPVAKLPAQVVAPAGKLTLFADFEKKSDNGVPLYLVNRTGKSVEVWTYLGQPLIAMEYESAPGKWKPAKAIDYALCGNSLVSLKLPKESFIVVPGYQPATGFKASVRYRIDKQATPVTGAGPGLVSHDDVSYLLVSETQDFAMLSKIATGEFIPPTETADWRPLAIRRLAEFGKEKAEPVLKSIIDGPDKSSATTATQALEFLRKFGEK